MRRSVLVSLALAGLAGMPAQNGKASSAVAVDSVGHLTRAYGIMFTAEEAKRTALELAEKHGWKDARVVASTGQYGYCAVALAYRKDGRRALIGISLGKPSQAEADKMAIAQCLKLGGYQPRVYARFEG